MTTKVRLVLSFVVAAALIGAACGDNKNSNSVGSTTTGGGSASTAGATTTKPPQTGGTITMGMFSETAGLDPIVSTGNGTTGNIELQAMFDTIVRYNVGTGKYDPETADSVTPNADYTQWTVKLKSGIKFTDGTAYDAAAVQFGLNRHRVGNTIPVASCAEWWACPRNATSSSAYMALVKDITVVDPLTLTITLTQSWPSFQYALSAEAGMIPSPTALKKCDATKDVRQCDFNLKPVGAGPFMIDSYKPQDSISMVKNPNFFKGAPYLDGVKFINNINDGGGSQTLQALQTGTLNMAFLRDPPAVADAHTAKFSGVSTFEQGGGILLLNTGAPVTCAGGKPEPTCTGKPDGKVATSPPTKDLKVRQAIAAAIDPSVINARGYQGKGLVGNQLFQSDFRWNPSVPGPKVDATTAKQLVTDAKAAGWDGKVRMLYNNTPTGMNIGIATKTMLEAAGITVDLDVSKTIQQQVAQVTVNNDFDLTGWGTAIPPDDGAVWALAQNLRSDSTSNRVGYKNPAVDQALSDILKATSDADKTAAYKTIAQALATDVPMLPWAKVEEFITWAANIHGVVQTNRGGVALDKAWIEK